MNQAAIDSLLSANTALRKRAEKAEAKSMIPKTGMTARELSWMRIDGG